MVIQCFTSWKSSKQPKGDHLCQLFGHMGLWASQAQFVLFEMSPASWVGYSSPESWVGYTYTDEAFDKQGRNTSSQASHRDRQRKGRNILIGNTTATILTTHPGW